MLINNEEVKVISALDLDPIKMKLMHVESGEGWPFAKTEAVELEYRRFLFLMKKFPDEQTAPSVDVDLFWHYHILDTVKYAADCETIFGYFLHHYPYLGMYDAGDEALQEQAGVRMRVLYQATFGPRTHDGSAAGADAGSATAWCALDTKAAWCAVKAKTAWCAVTNKTAWCAVNTKTAWCAVKAKTAWCAVNSKAAPTLSAQHQAESANTAQAATT